ncbi:MAG: hypothetical protein RLZZ210_1176 [Pseudomonadota bacterium]|jgi:thiol-disulfide isomerase/thioredoxin
MSKFISIKTHIKLVSLAITASLLISCSGGNLNQDKNSSLPMFNAVTLNNQTLKSSDWNNKVVILNFWATSCSACIAEMPKLAEVYTKYKDKGLNMLAVSMPYDAPSYVMNFAQSRALPFPIAMDLDGKITQSFGDITLTPTTFVYVNGKRVQKVIGEPNWQEFEALIEKSL